MSTPMPPRASLRTNSQPPQPKGNYSDRFLKKATEAATAPESKVDVKSTKDFPSLLSKAPVVVPNMVVMPAITFASKVKTLVATLEETKQKELAAAALKKEAEKKELLEQERYTHLYRHNVKTMPKEDTWNAQTEDSWGGTPEFGREEFLHQEDEEDAWS
jgi:hypothetical protein